MLANRLSYRPCHPTPAPAPTPTIHWIAYHRFTIKGTHNIHETSNSSPLTAHTRTQLHVHRYPFMYVSLESLIVCVLGKIRACIYTLLGSQMLLKHKFNFTTQHNIT